MARILPTRNGNMIWGMEALLHPWHGSYLQGMETPFTKFLSVWGIGARILPTRNGNSKFPLKRFNKSIVKHGSYLQGMETGVKGVLT